MTPLERQYRFLLRAYPRSYRQRRGDEIVGTMLDTARPGQRRTSWQDATDLLGGAVKERLGLHRVPGFLAGLRLAGPIALVLTAHQAVEEWMWTWLRRGEIHVNWSEPTIAALAFVWVAAVLIRALCRPGWIAGATN